MWLLSPTKLSYSNKEVQTIIRVYPHILENSLFASISSERSCQTVVSIKPDQENKKFYSMLEYTPYQEIQEGSLRILTLPRKPKITITTRTLERLHLGNCLYVDDDGLSELCLDLRERIRQGGSSRCVSFMETFTQTDLKVSPHILHNDDVANVITDMDIQTG